MNVTRVLLRASDTADVYAECIPELQEILQFWQGVEATPGKLDKLERVERWLADMYTAQSDYRRRLVEAVVNFAVLVTHYRTAREREVYHNKF